MIDLYGHLGASVEQVAQVPIPESQRRVHVVFETLAVFVAAPFLLYAATRPGPLSDWERAGLVSLAVGTLIVDGWLLSRWKP